MESLLDLVSALVASFQPLASLDALLDPFRLDDTPPRVLVLVLDRVRPSRQQRIEIRRLPDIPLPAFIDCPFRFDIVYALVRLRRGEMEDDDIGRIWSIAAQLCSVPLWHVRYEATVCMKEESWTYNKQ